MVKRLIVLSLLAFWLGGCADDRPVRKVPVNGSRLEKKLLQGSDFLFTRTILGGGAGSLGRRVPAGGVLVDAAPVKVQFTDSTLDVIRPVARRIEDNDREAIRVASFRARAVDVVQKRTVDDRLIAEEEETELRRPAAERSHAVVDFTDLPYGPLSTDVRQSTLLEPPTWLDDDHLTVQVQRTLADGSELRERISFRRLTTEPFVSRSYDPALRRRFGFFKRRHLASDDDGEMTFQNSETWAARWANQKKIVFTLAADVPTAWRAAVASVIKEWNDSIKVGAVLPGLELEQKPIGFADPRVNGIYRVEEPSPSEHGLLAYASVVIREDRGEIVNANIYLYGGALKRFRNYLRARLDDPGQTTRPSPFPAKSLPGTWLPPSLSLPRLLSAMGVAPEPKVEPKSALKEERLLPMGTTSSFSPLAPDFRRCGMHAGDGELERWASALPPGTDMEGAEAVLVRMLFAHELGHALGLRHNFLASADRGHFTGGNKSTSVMDYHATPPRFVLGPYDRAALMALYRDDKAINENHYWYCSERDPDDRRGTPDPLCAPYDEGTSLEEALAFHINRYKRDYRWLNERRGRVRFPDGADGEARYIQAIYERLLPLRRMVDVGIAASAANRGANMGRLWLLFGPRIEADEKTEPPDREPLDLPDGRSILLDRERVRSVRTDAVLAGEQSARMLARLVDTGEGARRPDLDGLDPETGRVERLGILRDRAIALLLLSLPTSSPLADGEVSSPLAVEDLSTVEAFTRVISGTDPAAAESVAGFRTRAAIPAPSALRYFAIELLRRLRDESNLLAPVVRGLLPLGPSNADPHALGRWRTAAIAERIREMPERIAGSMFALAPVNPFGGVTSLVLIEEMQNRLPNVPRIPEADHEDYRRLVGITLLEDRWVEEAATALTQRRAIEDHFRDGWQLERLKVPWTFAPTANNMSYYKSPCYKTGSGKTPISCFWLRDNIARLRLHLAAYQAFDKNRGGKKADPPDDVLSAAAWLAEETALLESVSRENSR